VPGEETNSTPMHCISLDTNDPFFNLAVEEILLKNSQEEYLILGINSTSVIVGKHQSSHKEVNTKFITENNIPVIRRITGGGTVFHDPGNLNFTFIRKSEEGKQVDFRKYTLPVVEFLATLGIDAKFEGKNDLKVSGFKISGNAEHVHRNRVLHHGTILFSTSLDNLRNSIRKDKSCYTTRAVESNPSPVMNLIEKLSIVRDIIGFREEMMNYFLKHIPGAIIYKLNSLEITEAEMLAEKKYKTWEWNWGYGPEYTFNNSYPFNGRQHNCSFSVKDGRISSASIKGSSLMSSFSDKLIGSKHMVADVLKILKDEKIPFSEEDIYNFF
jgi:lipoate---protein ligase